MSELLRAMADTLAGKRLPGWSSAACERGRGGVGSRGRGLVTIHLRRMACDHAGGWLLPFAPFDWVDIVDAAPIPVGVKFGATRHRQMIEQVRQRVFLTVESYYLCSAEHRLPLALAASNLNHGTGVVRKPVIRFPSRSPTITTGEAARLPPYPSARIS
jgi:hypothetical protein